MLDRLLLQAADAAIRHLTESRKRREARAARRDAHRAAFVNTNATVVADWTLGDSVSMARAKRWAERPEVTSAKLAGVLADLNARLDAHPAPAMVRDRRNALARWWYAARS